MPVMPALPPRAMPDNSARLRVLEATIETVKAENEILRRRLASAETWAAQTVITKRLDTRGPIGSMRRSPSLRRAARGFAIGLACGQRDEAVALRPLGRRPDALRYRVAGMDRAGR